jgi:hypothetical protein
MSNARTAIDVDDIDRAFAVYLRAIEDTYGFEIVDMLIRRTETGKIESASINWRLRQSAAKKAQS